MLYFFVLKYGGGRMKSKKENTQLKEHQKKAIDQIMKKDSIKLDFPVTKKQKKSKDRDTR